MSKAGLQMRFLTGGVYALRLFIKGGNQHEKNHRSTCRTWEQRKGYLC